jgi:hypothetical protein
MFMNKDQVLLEEAYKAIYESALEPLYIGEPDRKKSFLDWLSFCEYEVLADGSLKIEDNILFNRLNLTKIPFKFDQVNGYFMCSHNKLSSLEGSPRVVNGDFYCTHNKLSSLQGAPKIVKGDFICTDNPLHSLEGAPEIIKGKFQSDNFSDKDYRDYIKNEKYVKGKLEKDFDIDLGDF